MAIANPTQDAIGYPVPDSERYGDWERLLRQGDFAAFTRSLIEWNRQIAESVNLAMQGKLNNTGDLALTPNSATTLLIDPRIGARTKIFLDPTSANAKAEGIPWHTFPNATNGQLVLNHANNAQTDRNYCYCLIG